MPTLEEGNDESATLNFIPVTSFPNWLNYFPLEEEVCVYMSTYFSNIFSIQYHSFQNYYLVVDAFLIWLLDMSF